MAVGVLLGRPLLREHARSSAVEEHVDVGGVPARDLVQRLRHREGCGCGDGGGAVHLGFPVRVPGEAVLRALRRAS
ncbi:hypothetical protein [Streptomyces sp. NPDC017086]|uniref:hypothetical protein n=1 Tax=Streptomyces sp. NPDC017086 TaxID=3364976 RepID=UPI0037B185A5